MAIKNIKQLRPSIIEKIEKERGVKINRETGEETKEEKTDEKINEDSTEKIKVVTATKTEGVREAVIERVRQRESQTIVASEKAAERIRNRPKEINLFSYPKTAPDLVTPLAEWGQYVSKRAGVTFGAAALTMGVSAGLTVAAPTVLASTAGKVATTGLFAYGAAKTYQRAKVAPNSFERFMAVADFGVSVQAGLVGSSLASSVRGTALPKITSVKRTGQTYVGTKTARVETRSSRVITKSTPTSKSVEVTKSPLVRPNKVQPRTKITIEDLKLYSGRRLVGTGKSINVGGDFGKTYTTANIGKFQVRTITNPKTTTTKLFRGGRLVSTKQTPTYENVKVITPRASRVNTLKVEQDLKTVALRDVSKIKSYEQDIITKRQIVSEKGLIAQNVRTTKFLRGTPTIETITSYKSPNIFQSKEIRISTPKLILSSENKLPSRIKEISLTSEGYSLYNRRPTIATGGMRQQSNIGFKGQVTFESSKPTVSDAFTKMFISKKANILTPQTKLEQVNLKVSGFKGRFANPTISSLAELGALKTPSIFPVVLPISLSLSRTETNTLTNLQKESILTNTQIVSPTQISISRLRTPTKLSTTETSFGGGTSLKTGFQEIPISIKTTPFLVPTPLIPNLPDWDFRDYKPLKTKIESIKVTQPKGYSPSLYSSLLGIKGMPTRIGIASGLGVRPIMPRRF